MHLCASVELVGTDKYHFAFYAVFGIIIIFASVPDLPKYQCSVLFMCKFFGWQNRGYFWDWCYQSLSTFSNVLMAWVFINLTVQCLSSQGLVLEFISQLCNLILCSMYFDLSALEPGDHFRHVCPVLPTTWVTSLNPCCATTLVAVPA